MDRARDNKSLRDLSWGNVLVNTLRYQVRERPKVILNKGIVRVDIEIGLNKGLTHGMVGMEWWAWEPPSTQFKSKSWVIWVEHNEVPKPQKGIDIKGKT